MSRNQKPAVSAHSTVILKPGEADRVLAGHPWIYQGSVLRLTQPVLDGDMVQIKDHRHRFLGIGFYNSKSKISVRLISSKREALGQEFFESRIRAALELRRRHLPTASSFRVINSESDFLSGLIVDKYEDVLVVQLLAKGMDCRKSDIVLALQQVFSPRAIAERSEAASRKFEGLEESKGILHGDFDGSINVKLNGLTFQSNLLTGHKTGLYLDQQMNYALVAELAQRSQVRTALDCFCFQGGFSLHLAKMGVKILGLDQSHDSITVAQNNARINGQEDHCEFQAVNIFDWLKQQTVVGPHEQIVPRYDLIILDPPSFTRNRSTVPDAMRGYKEIHLRAMKLLKPGGTLATFCCSHHVDANLYRDVIMAAAFDARKVLRRVATFGQSIDHPVIPTIPETEYLKGFAFEVIPW